MKLAIMQPYLFPYVGYFQLIHAVDRFVVYDDVNYIKQGWVNRNRILVNGAPHMFTMPLNAASSFSLINELELGRDYVAWRSKFLKTITQVYRKAPYFEPTLHVVEDVLLTDRGRLVDVLVQSLRAVMGYIGITTELVPTSAIYGNKHLSGQARLLDICRQEGASDYINPIGGMELYSKAEFSGRGINLEFLRSSLSPYPQFGAAFQPGLSILDAMMFLSPLELDHAMNDHTLE